MCGVRLSQLGTLAPTGPILSVQSDDDVHECGSVGGLKIARGNSSLIIVTGYRLDGRGSIPGRSKQFFSTAFRQVLGSTQPPLQ
jgi:hypothetical protein